MFKNMLKRSWLSVKRKPSRSIIIGLILFAMSNLILATIVIKSAVNESTRSAKEQLGGNVSLQADMETLRENFKKQQDDTNNNSETQENQETQDSQSTTRPKFERPSVTKSTADAIATSDYVKDYTYSITSSANSDTLTAVETTSTNDGPGGDMMSGHGPGGQNGQNTENSGTYTIAGINAYAYISQVENGTMTIKEGEYFNEDNTGSALISVDLAEANNLSVGDTITLTNVNTSEPQELKIIGIYDVSDNNSNANTIYMNVDTAAKFLSTDDYNNGDYNVENVRYELKNAEDVDSFLSEITTNHPELADNNIVAKEDTAAYEQMVGPIENVGSFANTILWIVVGASIIIITLIVTINVKDRRYEMGVLLSLGAHKRNIIGQVFIELALVGTIAFAGSTITSTMLAQSMGQGILDAQIAAAQTESENNFGRPTSGGHGGPSGMPGKPGSSTSTNVETETEININAQPSDFALLFAAGYGIILIALLLPSINILRYQPKQILQGKE